MEFLEEVICRQLPAMDVLRTLCLFSTTCDGLKPKAYVPVRVPAFLSQFIAYASIACGSCSDKHAQLTCCLALIGHEQV